MIYDYEEQEGYVSLWIGTCENYNVIDEYLSTIYLDDDFDGDIEKAERSDVWKNLKTFESPACDIQNRGFKQLQMIKTFLFTEQRF